MYSIEPFKEHIVRTSGEIVYERVVEQLNSDDYNGSNCMGLMAYLFGLLGANVSLEHGLFSDMLKDKKSIAGLTQDMAYGAAEKPQIYVYIYMRLNMKLVLNVLCVLIMWHCISESKMEPLLSLGNIQKGDH